MSTTETHTTTDKGIAYQIKNTFSITLLKNYIVVIVLIFYAQLLLTMKDDSKSSPKEKPIPSESTQLWSRGIDTSALHGLPPPSKSVKLFQQQQSSALPSTIVYSTVPPLTNAQAVVASSAAVKSSQKSTRLYESPVTDTASVGTSKPAKKTAPVSSARRK